MAAKLFRLSFYVPPDHIVFVSLILRGRYLLCSFALLRHVRCRVPLAMYLAEVIGKSPHVWIELCPNLLRAVQFSACYWIIADFHQRDEELWMLRPPQSTFEEAPAL